MKKILSFILVCCMLMAVLTLTACGDKDKGDDNNDPDKNYGTTDPNSDAKVRTVTILDDEGNPVKGVKITFTNGGTTFLLAESDESGKAKSPAPMTSAVSIMVLSVPEGYEKPEREPGKAYDKELKADETEVTVTIKKIPDDAVTYTVKVVDQDGNAVQGVDVQICFNGICAPAVTTDKSGIVTKSIVTDGEVCVQLYELKNYTLPDPVKDNYHAIIEPGETEVTIVITKN